ncbi:hypothetical protein F2Q70_00030967 [Brassica cretica]|uniref:Uncharacterized protein n=2 Tax=Brassica cretica TaxID=69181 RepID=A0A8S9H3I6_BRACR|nr:hypothetical protein F2Q70_00030967 [Brassica cretica]KAF2551444.1 hypothetical protein F2Q68_00035351 [Brassica cretica]KAF3597687.1 hypothetical protein DY000_02023690 [Brassica cretica]
MVIHIYLPTIIILHLLLFQIWLKGKECGKVSCNLPPHPVTSTPPLLISEAVKSHLRHDISSTRSSLSKMYAEFEGGQKAVEQI